VSLHIKKFLQDQIELGLARFANDLRALPVAARAASPGGLARTPNDLAFEVASGNREFSRRMRGEVAGPVGPGDLPPTPAEFADVDYAVSELEAATEEFLILWDSVPDNKTEEPIAGTKSTPLGLATIVNRHIHYHDAQLNYIQTLLGDREIHW
jgi:hypothetical protein